MSELKVSVSGIRGIWGDSLTLETLRLWTEAFGKWVADNGGKKILIGRDGRPTGELITRYCSSILNAMGISTTDIGLTPTPTVLFGVRQNNFDAGLIITASHNPVQWNALKFVKRGGVFTGEADVEAIKANYGKPIPEAAYDKIGKSNKDVSIPEAHIARIVGKIDAGVVVSKGFKVVLDPVNSAGGKITNDMFAQLGCKVKTINGEVDGTFHRVAEPTPANLKDLGPAVREFGADAGFAQDPDADRLVVADEKGNVLSEELTLALAVKAVLSQKKGDVVINMSTSGVIDEIAAGFGSKVFRTKVGEANVVEGIDRYGALIAGEGNGGVIYPEMNKARDSLAGIALILELMAKENKPLSEITASLPVYTMLKEKFDFAGSLAEVYEKLQKKYSQASSDMTDGMRIEWKEDASPVWIHVRASNTEPVIRLIGESKDPAVIRRVMDECREVILGGN